MPLASNASSPIEVSGVAPSLAVDGLFSGILGGLVVALFYLALDTLQGRPLHTPSLLGSVIFGGESTDSIAGVSLRMAAAYSVLHMALFIAAGMAGAFMVAQFERHPPVGVILLLLFICFEAGFFSFTMALAPGVFEALGKWSVAVANVLAAGVMAVYFWRTHPVAAQNLQRIWQH